MVDSQGREFSDSTEGQTAIQGTRKKEDEFEFNKDAGMYMCKAGHLAIRKARQGKKGVSNNQVDTYYFDVDKCKRCPYKEGCYKEGAKRKTYSVTIKSNEHSEQEKLQESEYFKEKSKERYKIEAKKRAKTQTRVRCSYLLGSNWHGATRSNGNFHGEFKKNFETSGLK